MAGKLSRLPLQLRLQLNQRIADGHPASQLLPWLNSLPEVKSILDDHFGGAPVSEQNLSDYRKNGFRRWELREAALEFAAEQTADSPPSSQIPASPLVDHLVRWIATRFAAAAQNAPIPEDPETDLREIRAFLADVVVLRRGDLVARRLDLEKQRLALEQTKTQPEQEKLFWEWTKRPDIRAKLFPQHDPDKARRAVVSMIDHHVLGLRATDAPDPEPDPDPACLI